VNILNTLIFFLSVVLGSYLLGGGIYRYEHLKIGVAHKTNIITGDIFLCAMDQECLLIGESKPERPTKNVGIAKPAKIDPDAIYSISYIRKGYSQYDDWSDEVLAEGLYKKYIEGRKDPASKKAFFEVIGFKVD